MITGKGARDGGGYPYAGRPAEKYYLYEIISNKLTGNIFNNKKNYKQLFYVYLFRDRC